MFNTNQSTYVLVNNAAVSSGVNDDVSLADLSVLEAGEIAIVNDQFKTQDVLVKGDKFKFVLKDSSTTIKQTPWLIYNDNLRAYAKPNVDAAEQVSYIGYTGSSGSLTATSLNDYVLGITFKHDKDMWSEQANKRIFYYTSDASATQAEIAVGLTSAMGFDTFLTDDVKVELLTDSAGTACPTGVDTITFTNGSTTISATDIDNATGTSAIAVGDFIRFAADTAGTGAEVTDVVYKIVSIDATANTAQLHMPYQGTSGTIDDTDTEIIVAATAATAAFGIKLTGIAQPFSVGKLKYNKVRFDVTLKNFGSTAVTYSTAANLGNGSYEQVAELEWFAEGFRKAPDRVGDSAPTYTLMATSGQTYDIISVHADVANSPNHAISGQKNAQVQVILAFIETDTVNSHEIAAHLYTTSAVPGMTTATPF